MKHTFKFVMVLLFMGNVMMLRAQTGKDAALETIGAVSGATIYNTYVAIGSVADGYEDKVYDADYTIVIMNEQVNMMESLIETFKTLKSSGFISDPSDKEYIEEIVLTMGYLRDEAQSLIDYVNGGDPEAFQENRTLAWEHISDLLGLEK